MVALSNLKFKKQARYPEGDHTVFKQEYWDHPIRKRPKHWIQQTQQNCCVEQSLGIGNI